MRAPNAYARVKCARTGRDNRGMTSCTKYRSKLQWGGRLIANTLLLYLMRQHLSQLDRMFELRTRV